MRQHEIELNLRMHQTNPEAKQAFELARLLNKTIVVTEQYLKKEAMTILENNGYNGVYKVYGYTKYVNMLNTMNDLSVEQNEILHIDLKENTDLVTDQMKIPQVIYEPVVD